MSRNAWVVRQAWFLILNEQGNSYNRKTMAAGLHRQWLRIKAPEKYKAATDSNHNLPVAPNLLAQVDYPKITL